MTIVTPVDGQPAVAEHVAQLTETLLGIRAEPVTLAARLRLHGLSDGDTVFETRPVAASSYPKFSLMTTGMMQWGDGTDNAFETYLYRQAANVLRLEGNLQPDSHNWWELGSSARTWKKLWAQDVQTSNHVGVGSAVTLPVGTNDRVVQIGTAQLRGDSALNANGWLNLGFNTYYNGSVVTSYVNAAGAAIQLSRSGISFFTYDAVAPGTAQPTYERVRMASDGDLILDPGGAEAISSYGDVNPGQNLTQYLGQTGSRWAMIYGGGGSFSSAVSPSVTNTADLGTTALRWRKLWAVDGEFTNAPTVGGVALPTAAALAAYLPLVGGTVTGLLDVQRGVSTDLALTVRLGAEANPRWRVRTDGAVGWGPGGATAEDTYLYRISAGALRLDSHLAVGIAPAPWLLNNYRALQVGSSGSLHSGATATLGTTYLANNSYVDAGGDKAQYTGTAARLAVGVSGGVQIQTAASATQNLGQTFAPRLTVSNLGLTTLSPASGDALSAGGGLMPATASAYDLGLTGTRWRKLYADDADLGLLGFTGDTYLSRISAGTLKIGDGPGTSGALYLGDTLVQRTGAGALRLDNSLGIGVAPAAWGANQRALQVGQTGAVWGAVAAEQAQLASNAYFDGTNYNTIVTGPAVMHGLVAGVHTFYAAGSVTGGQPLTWTTQAVLQGGPATALQLVLGGSTAKTWQLNHRVLQLSNHAMVYSKSNQYDVGLLSSSYINASSGFSATQNSFGAGHLRLYNSSLTFATAPAVGAVDASQSFTTRMYIIENGQVQLTPAAGVAAVTIGGTAQPKITVASGAPSSPMTGDLWVW